MSSREVPISDVKAGIRSDCASAPDAQDRDHVHKSVQAARA
jgi:hypothetical protein